MSEQRSQRLKSSAREFTIIVLCALGLSVIFVYWIKSVGGLSAYAGLDVGKVAPPIEASFWVQGDAPDRETESGDVKVLVAWATWCVPCYKKAPELVEAQHQFSDRGVRFFGLTAAPEQDRDLILEWLEDRKITWPNGFGPLAVETLLAYEAEAIPGVWVIGRDGTILWNRSLEADESMEEALERALRQPSGKPSDDSGASAISRKGDEP